MDGLRTFDCAPGIACGPDLPLVIIAGPCAVEPLDTCRRIAASMKAITEEIGLPYIFKASFDKANRTSLSAPRGPGMARGLEMLAAVGSEFSVPLLTDVHETGQVNAAAEVVDVLQIPAFLCRQTDLLVAAGASGRTVNIKKGQFMAPEDMGPAMAKVESTGNTKVMLTERGSTFGYHNLVVDMRGLVTMRELGAPVIFDGTHSVQLPGGRGNASGGRREFVRPLVRAAVAVGVQGIFLEVHPKPEEALSDAANSLSLDDARSILKEAVAIHERIRSFG